MPYELVIQAAGGPPRRVVLEGERYTIGRARANDLCTPDDGSLSRVHVLLERDQHGWWVSDRNSKNGTFVNGVRLTARQRLELRDRLGAGQLSLTFVASGQPLEEPGVVFEPGSGPELHPAATVMTSLEGLLSGEATAAEIPALSFESPAVRALFRAVRELAQHRPLAELFRLVLDLSIEAVRAERGVLMTLEGETLVARAVHGQDLRISTAVRDRVLREKASILVRDRAQDDVWQRQISIIQQQITSLMAVPLQTEDRVIGLVYVDSRSPLRAFTPEDLSLLTALAHVGAIGIEQEVFRLGQRDLQRAAEIQRGILPASPPDVPGLELAGHNAPCRTVGGDYYDFLLAPDGKLGLVLGDVAGKGMSAALLMMNIQARVQHLTEGGLAPAILLDRLNVSLCRSCPSNKFISLFVCAIDPASGRMLYANAGHNPPLLVRADGSCEKLSERGSVLGIWPEARYEEREDQLRPGDLLAIYSDGITEASLEDGEEFGLERLERILVAERHLPIDGIIEAVNHAVRSFTGAAPAGDDVTLVVARRSADGP